MFTFQLSTDTITATVQTDGPVHPDLLDEMGARCIRLFAEGNDSLDYEDDSEPDDAGA